MFFDVNITEVRKPRKIASLSSLGEGSGSRVWEDKPGRYTLNHIILEDLCRFQDITFEFIGGVYYPKDNRIDVSFREYFLSLYKRRERYKEEENPLEEVFKLVMNSTHGKQTQRPIEKQEEYIEVYTEDRLKEASENELAYLKKSRMYLTPEQFENYKAKNFQEIIEIRKLEQLGSGG